MWVERTTFPQRKKKNKMNNQKTSLYNFVNGIHTIPNFVGDLIELPTSFNGPNVRSTKLVIKRQNFSKNSRSSERFVDIAFWLYDESKDCMVEKFCFTVTEDRANILKETFSDISRLFNIASLPNNSVNW